MKQTLGSYIFISIVLALEYIHLHLDYYIQSRGEMEL